MSKDHHQTQPAEGQVSSAQTTEEYNPEVATEKKAIQGPVKTDVTSVMINTLTQAEKLLSSVQANQAVVGSDVALRELAVAEIKCQEVVDVLNRAIMADR